MAKGTENHDYFVLSSCIRGYHIYKEIWTPSIGEVLLCAREPTNIVDRYAVSVQKDETIVGHLPKRISRVCSLFFLRGGSLSCQVTGKKRYSRDLVQRGLEVPYFILFSSGSQKDVANF